MTLRNGLRCSSCSTPTGFVLACLLGVAMGGCGSAEKPASSDEEAAADPSNAGGVLCDPVGPDSILRFGDHFCRNIMPSLIQQEGDSDASALDPSQETVTGQLKPGVAGNQSANTRAGIEFFKYTFRYTDEYEDSPSATSTTHPDGFIVDKGDEGAEDVFGCTFEQSGSSKPIYSELSYTGNYGYLSMPAVTDDRNGRPGRCIPNADCTIWLVVLSQKTLFQIGANMRAMGTNCASFTGDPDYTVAFETNQTFTVGGSWDRAASAPDCTPSANMKGCESIPGYETGYWCEPVAGSDSAYEGTTICCPEHTCAWIDENGGRHCAKNGDPVKLTIRSTTIHTCDATSGLDWK